MPTPNSTPARLRARRSPSPRPPRRSPRRAPRAIAARHAEHLLLRLVRIGHEPALDVARRAGRVGEPLGEAARRCTIPPARCGTSARAAARPPLLPCRASPRRTAPAAPPPSRSSYARFATSFTASCVIALDGHAQVHAEPARQVRQRGAAPALRQLADALLQHGLERAVGAQREARRRAARCAACR